MSNRTKRFIGFGFLLLFCLILVACQGTDETVAPTQRPRPTETVAPTEAPTQTPLPSPAALETVEVPFLEAWLASAHADVEAEAFNHWNEEDPVEIPAECAKCHSTPGFQDYTGADGTPPMQVEQAHAVGSVITCVACHNTATATLDTVEFPSGAVLTGVGSQSLCMTCHQGTASKVQVDANIEAAGAAANPDQPFEELGFTNIHYYAAAVSRFGTLVKGGYEYDGKTYDAMFDHAGGVESCNDCHDPHTLELKTAICTDCHEGADDLDDIREIRMASSFVDYDGDGNLRESVADEINGLRGMLYSAMQNYAFTVVGTPIVYSEEAYPYFFIDTNENGQPDEEDMQFPNRYNAWTARLARAAYNYQTSLKDGGAYVHGGKYIIQLLYDSIEDLNSQLEDPVSLETAHRNDPGHFAGSEEAFRHWDAEGEVPGTCVKCHTGEGLPMFIANNAVIATKPSNGLLCETCHDNLQEFTQYTVNSVPFPSGVNISYGEAEPSNLCLQCHQGRESTVSVNRAIGSTAPDEINERLTFRNVHYFAAGATQFGGEARGGYQYDGQEYSGRFTHVDRFDTCAECHDEHALSVNIAFCDSCHETDNVEEIRGGPGVENTIDYDGDGDIEEGIAGEIKTMLDVLYESLTSYAANTLNQPIVYTSASHPYFFNDTNGNGQPDPDEINNDNRFVSWSPRLLRAAYNYQYVSKDPGGFAHNADYIMQLLYDSIRDTGGPVQGMTRPAVTP